MSLWQHDNFIFVGKLYIYIDFDAGGLLTQVSIDLKVKFHKRLWAQRKPRGLQEFDLWSTEICLIASHFLLNSDCRSFSVLKIPGETVTSSMSQTTSRSRSPEHKLSVKLAELSIYKLFWIAWQFLSAYDSLNWVGSFDSLNLRKMLMRLPNRPNHNVWGNSETISPIDGNFSRNDVVNFPTKFGVKFTTSFPSSRFDWQLQNEIAKFVA